MANQSSTTDQPLFGVLAEFTEPEDLVEAARKTYETGYREYESYSPFPVHGLAEAMEFKHTWVPYIVLIGGLTGCIVGFGLQYWTSVIDYPLNIGGRPNNSWPAFIPVTFEMTILCASLSAVLGMLALNGLPRPNHPLFAVKKFSMVTEDRFFLLILSRDPNYNEDEVREFLTSLEPKEVIDVPF